MEDYLDAINRVDLLDQLYLWGTQKTRDSLADLLDQFLGKIEEDALKTRWKKSTKKLREKVDGLSLEALQKDHEFLLRGDVFTEDVIRYWIKYKMESEVAALRARPHPYEFCLYFDI